MYFGAGRGPRNTTDADDPAGKRMGNADIAAPRWPAHPPSISTVLRPEFAAVSSSHSCPDETLNLDAVTTTLGPEARYVA